MQAQGYTSSRRDAQVHKGGVSAALAEEVKGHEEEAADHVNVRVLEHAVKGEALRLAKVMRPNVAGRGRRLDLRADGDDKVQRRPSLRTDSHATAFSASHESLLELRGCKHVDEPFSLARGVSTHT